MAIKPICDRCGQELTAFGGLLFSPPDEQNHVTKLHVCVNCYADILKEFKHNNS